MKPTKHKQGALIQPSTAPPLFWECGDCGYLSDDPRVAAGEATCHACGYGEPAELRQFPAERLRRLDTRIRRYHAERESEIVVILAASFLEALLEDILARIMEAQGADVRLRAAVLDAQRSIGQRLGRLFPALTGEEFEAAAAHVGFRDFPARWRTLRSERNAFIHDSAFEGAIEQLTDASAKDAMVLLDQAYRLFVSLNNRFVSRAQGHASS